MTKYSIEKKLYVKVEAESMKRVLTESEGIHTKRCLRWPVTVSSTFEDLEFDGSL